MLTRFLLFLFVSVPAVSFADGDPRPYYVPVTQNPTLFQTNFQNIAVDAQNRTYIWNGVQWANYVFDNEGRVWMDSPYQPGIRISVTDPGAVKDLRGYWTQWPLEEGTHNEQILRPFLGLKEVPMADGKTDGLRGDGKWLYWKGKDNQTRVINIDPNTGEPFFTDGTKVSDAVIKRLQDQYAKNDALKEHPLVKAFNKAHPVDGAAAPPQPPAPASPAEESAPPAPPVPEGEAPPLEAAAAGEKKCALLMAGPANKPPLDEDFGRVIAAEAYGLRKKGYDVTLLTGWGDAASPTDATKFINEKVKPIGGPGSLTMGELTEEKVDDFFKNKSEGCKKLITSVHGHGSQCQDGQCNGPTCAPGAAAESTQDDLNGPGHYFASDPSHHQFESQKLVSHIAEIEKKMPVEFILNSCHSGRIKKFLAGLKNTCTVALSTGNAPGFGCGDKDRTNDYTSTLEVVHLREYGDYLKELGESDYFKNSVCFDHMKEQLHKICEGMRARNCLDTMDHAFWKGRLHDRTPQEPFISSTLATEAQAYFTSGKFNRAMVHGEMVAEKPRYEEYFPVESVPADSVSTGLDQIMALGTESNLLKSQKNDLMAKLQSYNVLLDQEKAKVAQWKSATTDAKKTTLANELSQTQLDLREQSNTIVALERNIVNTVRLENPEKFGESPGSLDGENDSEHHPCERAI